MPGDYDRVICAPCNKDMRLVRRYNDYWYAYECDECLQTVKIRRANWWKRLKLRTTGKVRQFCKWWNQKEQW